jgi:hypothetical protein
MSTSDNELTQFNEKLLQRAATMTEAQFDAARKIAANQFGADPVRPPHEMLLAITQILATNYLAAITKSNG